MALAAYFVLDTSKIYAQMPAAVPQFLVQGRKCVPDAECKSDSTQFLDTLKTATAWRWNFGDPNSMAQNTSTRSNVKHVFRQPGTYQVTLLRSTGARVDTLRQMVAIGNLPQPYSNWRRDTVICKGNPIKLDPYPLIGPSGAKYLWYPKGDTTKTLTVDTSGCYSVQTTLPNGCTYEDRINVKVCLEPANQEGAKWFFGNNAGLDFTGGQPRPITDGKLNTPEGTSSISNNKGKLLFYTDGIQIYDKDGTLMASRDTSRLSGSPNSTQSALIVPQPVCRGCDYLYYVFTTSEVNGRKQLSYSIVDMRKNGGKGEVTQKNIPLQNPTTERLAAAINPRDTTYWIISHDYGNNTFRVYHSTTAGLQEAGAYSVGLPHNTNDKAEGYIKLSGADTTGTRTLAVIVPGPPRNQLQLFDFDNNTGRISNPRTIDLGPAPPKAYGVEFSPDNSKLYVSFQGNGTAAAPSRLLQFDIALRDSTRIADSKIQIDSSATQIYGALQAASNGKIYLAIKDSQFLGVINEPDEDSQQEVMFIADGQTLGGKTSQLGLPSFVQDFSIEGDGFGIEYADTCSNRPTMFMAQPVCSPLKNTFVWNFGDGSIPTPSAQGQTQHTYTKAGTYKVTLQQTIFNGAAICKDTTISATITIIETPGAITLKNPIDTCANVLRLDAGVTAQRYLWTRNGIPVGRDKVLSLNNAQSGTYQVIAANGSAGQCPNRGNTMVSIRRPPAINIGPDTSICTGTSGSIRLSVAETTWRTFRWSNGSTMRDILVTQPGTYSVQVVNGNQCVNNDTIVIRALPKPNLQANFKIPTSCTAKDGGITAIITPASTTYRYQWFSPTGSRLRSTTNIVDSIGQGKYRLLLSGTNQNCALDTSVTLKAVSDIRVDTTIIKPTCLRPTSGVINLFTVAGSPFSYSWTNAAGMRVGGNVPTITNLGPGKYSVKITDEAGCDAELKDIVVGIDQSKFINLGPDRIKCIGDTVLLLAQIPTLAGNTFSWSTGETTNRLVVRQDGTYKLSFNNALTGCKDADEIAVTFAPRPEYDFTKNVPICVPDGQAVNLIVTGRSPDLSYFWPHSSERLSKVRVNRNGNYIVRISNPAGCVLQDTARVFIACEPRVYIPDAFSPNGDNQNDVLNVYGDHYTGYELRIFNRWGEMIFYSDNIEKRWDGTYKGLLYPPMVYPYVVSFGSKYYPDRPRVNNRGAILLVR